MKERICLLLCSILLLSSNIKYVPNIEVIASSNSETATTEGLGYAINAVKSEYLDLSELKDGSPIFVDGYIENKIASGNYIDLGNKTTSKSIASNSFEDIANSFSTSLGYSASIGGSYDIFTANLYNNFSLSNKRYYNSYMSQVYYQLNSTLEMYTYSLPNYSSNLTDYRNNLHSDYISAVTQLFSNELSGEEFFDMYGTHMIAKGIYGGKLEMYYSAFSNDIDIGNKYFATIKSGLDVGFRDIFGVSSNYYFSLLKAVDYREGETVEEYSISTIGGSGFDTVYMDDFKNRYSSWFNTISSNPTLIGTSSDGLIPLWNLLPSQYNTTYYKNLMKDMYNEYTKNYIESIYTKLKFSDNGKLLLEEMEIRNEEYKITDDGRFVHNKHDTIDLSTLTPYSSEVLHGSGYSLDITIKMQMKEVNKGYQYIMIYNSEEKDNAYLVYEDDAYEYGGTDLVTTYGEVEFHFNLSLDDFSESDLLVIRYGASGEGEDTWANKKLRVLIQYKK